MALHDRCFANRRATKMLKRDQTKTNGPRSGPKKVLVHGRLRRIVVVEVKPISCLPVSPIVELISWCFCSLLENDN